MLNSPIKRIYVRLPNWIGDVCMCLPCLHAVISTGCDVVVCGKPWANELLSGLQGIRFIPFTGKWNTDKNTLKSTLEAHTQQQSVGLLLPDSLSSALAFRLAGLPCAGYKDDGRSLLLRWAITKPKAPLHAVESWYYLTHYALTQWGFNVPENPDPYLHLPLTTAHEAQAQALLSPLNHAPFILIAPTATGKHKGKEKIWPFFEILTKQLQKKGMMVVMSPPAQEKEMALTHAPSASLLPPIGLGGFIALLKKADVVICNDSGVSHLAALGAKKQITLIGVTDPIRTAPWSADAIVLGSMGHWPRVDEVMAHILNVSARTKTLQENPSVFSPP